jgi:hypothetical protein
MDVNIPNDHRIYQLFSFQGPHEFTQILIFGLKTYHLATLCGTTFVGVAEENQKPIFFHLFGHKSEHDLSSTLNYCSKISRH